MKRLVLTTALFGILSTGTSRPLARALQQPSPSPSSQQSAIVGRYCVTCHNEKLRTAQLTLDTLNLSDPSANAATWEKVIKKLRAGAMPPQGSPRPEKTGLD